jgi:hypothetical protein
MNWSLLTGRRSIDVPCVVEVENTFESLHAHVKLRNGIVVHPGDEVLVHGDPVEVPYGQRRVIERMATVTRAGWLERLWTRATGDLEFMELCEFSFSGSSKL